MPKKVLVALPPAMLETCDHIATQEHRTRSDLIREALRRYIETFNRKSFNTATLIKEPAISVTTHEEKAPVTT